MGNYIFVVKYEKHNHFCLDNKFKNINSFIIFISHKSFKAEFLEKFKYLIAIIKVQSSFTFSISYSIEIFFTSKYKYEKNHFYDFYQYLSNKENTIEYFYFFLILR